MKDIIVDLFKEFHEKYPNIVMIYICDNYFSADGVFSTEDQKKIQKRLDNIHTTIGEKQAEDIYNWWDKHGFKELEFDCA